MRWSLLLIVNLLFTLNNSIRGEWGQIKINEPRASSNNNNNYNSNNDNNNNNNNDNNNAASTSYRDPHSETENSEIVISSVIEYLTNRKGETIEGTHDKYTYKVFLFEKVEQSENWYSWNLGIFDKWDYCDSTQTDSELCLQFTDGQVCGSGVGRSSHVHFVCNIPDDKDNTKEQLYDISEPQTCSYHMNMYIPQICDLVNNNINHLFAGRDNTNSQTKSQTGNGINNGNALVGNVNVIGDTSDLMNKLNGIMNKQNEQSELDQLWKLCLMSLMIDDEGKLNKIKKVANMFMIQSNDISEEQTEICDFYLEQILKENKKQTVVPLPQTDDEIEMSTEKPTGVLVSDEENTGVVMEENDENESENGGVLDEDNNDVDKDGQNSENDEVIFQSGGDENNDKIVFQSGDNQDNEQDDIENTDNEEEVLDIDVVD